MPGEDTMVTSLSLQDEIKQEWYEIFHQPHEETTRHTHQISDMNNEFGFLTSLSYLMDPSKDSNIAMKMHHLTQMYDDVIARELQSGIHHL